MSAPLAMTLCGIAYAFPEDIQRFLGMAELTKSESWTAAWVPEERKGYFAYAATSPNSNDVVVAVRGTNPSLTEGFLWNLLSNVNVRSTSEWSPAVQGVRIAGGAREGLSVLLSIKDKHGRTLGDYLESVPRNATVVVTGHSLGGCLASVLALHLSQAAGGRSQVKSITFAAPTAGDEGFAKLFHETFPNAERYFNPFDLVPRAWHDLSQFPDLYEAPGPKCPWLLARLARRVNRKVSGHKYTHPGPGKPLPTPGGALPERPARRGVKAGVDRLLRRHFLLEALHHHVPNTYLALLGAKELPFPLPLPWLFRNVRRRLSRLWPWR
ncbi:MAG: lipase family protein [Longimicrobiaceae bacterium]